MDGRTDLEVSRNGADAPLVSRRGGSAFTLPPETGQSTEDRLASILEMIRTWDWRSSGPDDSQSGGLSRPSVFNPAQVAATAPELLADPPRLQERQAPQPQIHSSDLAGAVAATAATAGLQDISRDEMSSRPIQSDTGQVAIDQVPAVATAVQPETTQRQDSASPVAMIDPIDDRELSESDESDQGPQASPRRFGRLIIAVIAIAIVIVIIVVIRLTVANPSSGSLTPTTVHSGATTGSSALIPVSSAVKADFVAASNPLDAANVTVTKALSGSGQSVAQVALEITPYVTALNNFDAAIHTVPWPSAMQLQSEALIQKTQALLTFTTSISSVNAATLNSWVAQFRVLAADAQNSDNLVRKDIGLAATTNYP
jgi:hypothetical protein